MTLTTELDLYKPARQISRSVKGHFTRKLLSGQTDTHSGWLLYLATGVHVANRDEPELKTVSVLLILCRALKIPYLYFTRINMR